MNFDQTKRYVAPLIAILSLGAAGARASSFSVAPIRVEVDRAHRTGVLTLRNDSDTSVVVQVTTVAWSQDATTGEDHYEETRDILATPPVFEVPAHGDQIVRVAMRRDADASTELPYRVYFEEVPQARTTTFNGLNVALRIGLPAFIAPAAPVNVKVDWDAAWQADGTLRLSATNLGNVHLQVTDFDVQFGTMSTHIAGSRYLLAGTHASWTVSPPVGFDREAALHVKGFSDRGDLSADIALTSP